MHFISPLSLRPRGYFVSTDPDPTKSKGQQAVVEHDTFSCGHCNRIVLVKPMCPPNEMPGGICWGCQRFICTPCAVERDRTTTCDVIEKKLERWEAKDRFRRELAG